MALVEVLVVIVSLFVIVGAAVLGSVALVARDDDDRADPAARVPSKSPAGDVREVR